MSASTRRSESPYRLRYLRYLGLALPIARLLLRLGWALIGVGWARRGALRAYRRSLERAGLPGPFIEELARSYELKLTELLPLARGFKFKFKFRFKAR